MTKTILLTGSVGAGKTTLAHYLSSYFSSKEYDVKYIQTSIGHGPAYILLKFIMLITKYNYIGNYYLSLWFNNPVFFIKIVKIIIFFDIMFSPIVYLKKVSFPRLLYILNKRYTKSLILIVDEYFITMAVEYIYFTRRIKNDKCTKMLLQIFFVLTLKYTKMLFKSNGIIIILKYDLKDSIISWIKREKTKLVDINLLFNRNIVSEYIVTRVLTLILSEKAEVLKLNRNKLNLKQILIMVSSLIHTHDKLD